MSDDMPISSLSSDERLMRMGGGSCLLLFGERGEHSLERFFDGELGDGKFLLHNKYREEQLAESAIVYANRDRNHQADVHQQLSVLEESFFEGEFVKVYHDANAIYRRMHVEEAGNNGR